MGVIYKIDADNFLKIINSHIEPEITQLEILLPDQKGETDMEITYDTSEGIKNNFILSTQI